MSISPYLVTQVRVAHNDDDESVKCEICMNGDTTEEEEILLCDLCNGAVHQSCYGRDIEYNIPDGDWFCERCNEIVATKKIPKCTLCGGLKGVMVQTDRLKWVHPICVNWMPGIYFFDAEVGKTPHMYKVGGNIDKDLVSSKCKYCGKSSGTCITCEYKNCTAHFHVYCSAMKGCIKDYQDANELSQVENHGYCPVFCTQHETLGTKTFKEHGYKGIKAAEHPVQSEEKIRLKKRNMKCRMKMNEDDDEENMKYPKQFPRRKRLRRTQ
ncbi:unnamed protein product [Moneuplotes crassus]|uniref:Uncharacterized protein n=1 Tax=Euplotes crassus TaxID=5936 RepID=A0AAD1UG43_EUPCR|nr:unnamed protein product [Moneuplotes crassus]